MDRADEVRQRVRRGFLLVRVSVAGELHVGRDAALVDGLIQLGTFRRQLDLRLVDGSLHEIESTFIVVRPPDTAAED
jgi:hypothetical protein